MAPAGLRLDARLGTWKEFGVKSLVVASRGAFALVLLAAGCGHAAPASPAAAAAPSSATPLGVKVGTKVPAFSLARVDGKGTATLPNGKVTLVAFWALGWGGDYGLSRLDELHRRYAAQGLDVIVVSHDAAMDVLPGFLEQRGLTVPLVWDERHAVIDRWRPDNIMSAYVLDRDGVVRLVRSSGKESAPSNLPSVDDKIRELLGLPRSAIPRGDGPEDGSAVAAPSPTGVSTLRVVAVLGADAHLRAWGKERLVVDAGLFVYGPRAGALALLGSPRDYAIDRGGDDLVGPDSRSPLHGPARHLSPWPQQVVLVTRSATWWDVRGWNGTRWGQADVDPERVGETDFEDGYFSGGCKPVLTADAAAYTTCGDSLQRIVEVGRSEPIGVAGLSTFRAEMPVAVAHDGAMWFGSDDHVRRVTADGHVTDLVLPVPSAELSRPGFVSAFESETWQSTKLEPARPALRPKLSKIVPLTDGSVWLLAHSPSPARRSIVYRHGPGEPAPIVVGSPTDQQLEVRNAVGVRAWKASCPQAFVAADDPKRPLASWADTVRATFDDARRHKVSAYLVEGKLAERTVRGVVLHLSEPRADQRALARATATLVAQLGGAGGAPAEAFCSLPVVTHTSGER